MRYSGCSRPGCKELRALGWEYHSPDLVCLPGLRRLSGTRLFLLDTSSVTQRPSEKLEAPGFHGTDLGLQALPPEINIGANQGSVACSFVGGREEMLVSGLDETGGEEVGAGRENGQGTCWDKEEVRDWPERKLGWI